MCTAINIKSQYEKGQSIIGVCVSKREATNISEPQKHICKDAIHKNIRCGREKKLRKGRNIISIF